MFGIVAVGELGVLVMQGVMKIFSWHHILYTAHCAVIFATAQLFC